AGSCWIRSTTDVAPLRSIASRRMICTGSAPSPAMRGSAEPVISTRSSSCASAPTLSRLAPSIAASSEARLVHPDIVSPVVLALPADQHIAPLLQQLHLRTGRHRDLVRHVAERQAGEDGRLRHAAQVLHHAFQRIATVQRRLLPPGEG